MKRSRLVTDTARSPGRPRSQRSHDAILRAAIVLIREVGYDAVTMEGIALRAGVGKATLYRRWKSKELLVAEAIGQIVRSIPVPDTGSISGDLERLLTASLGMYSDPATGLLLSGLVAAMARSDMISAAIRNGFVAVWHDAAREVVRRGVARGEIRRGTDSELLIDMLAAPLFYRFLLTGADVDSDLVRSVVRAVLRAFAPSPARRP